jgi:carboxyl-terminal processing protease
VAADGDAGLVVRIVEGRAVVTAVCPDGSADAAGVRPGWIVTRIDGTDIDGRIAEMTAMWHGHTGIRLAQTDVVELRLLGPARTTVAVEFLDEGDRPVTVDVLRTPREGFAARMGDLPTTWVTFDARRLEGRFGYIHLGSFAAPNEVMPRLAEAMGDFMDADGIVLDLRGNRGGLAPMTVGFAAWFVSERGRRLGTMHTRASELSFVVHPRADVYEGPLVVLVDGLSASAAEFLAGGLQGLGRARVLGTTSAGAALPAALERLPNGDGLIYAIADYVSADGQRLEGRGVVPDEVVDHTRADLLDGEDAALRAALDWLRNENRPRPARSDAAAGTCEGGHAWVLSN